MSEHNYELHRNVSVSILDIKEYNGQDGNLSYELTVDIAGNAHTFGRNNHFSKQLLSHSSSEVEDMLSGKSYFFVEGSLVDFTTKEDAFIHTDAAIEKLAAIVGITAIAKKRSPIRHEQNLNNLFSSKRGNKFELGGGAEGVSVQMANSDEGGELQGQIRFGWSPFRDTIGSTVEIQRMWCLNGCYNNSVLKNSEVRITNLWEEHYEMAKEIMNDDLRNVLKHAFDKIALIPATIFQIQFLNRHAEIRSKSCNDQSSLRRLMQLRYETEDGRTKEFYDSKFGGIKSDVFDNSGIASTMASHYSLFDAWNIATEMATHTPECDGSKNDYLVRFANMIAFKEEKHLSYGEYTLTDDIMDNVDRAFFGESPKVTIYTG